MTPAAGNTRSVLLAEHEPEVAEMSARYLRRDGLRVRLVTTPRDVDRMAVPMPPSTRGRRSLRA